MIRTEYTYMFVIAAAFYIVFVGAVLISIAVGRWLVFKKLGLPGWKGIIPFYGQSILFRRFWKIKMFWLYFAMYMGYSALCTVVPVLGFSGFFHDIGRAAGVLFALMFPALLYGMLAAILVLCFKLYHRLAKAFGRTAGFAAGLTFIPPVFF